LGLEAQRKAAYAANADLTSVNEFTEVETGKGADALEKRPVFAAVRKAKNRRQESLSQSWIGFVPTIAQAQSTSKSTTPSLEFAALFGGSHASMPMRKARTPSRVSQS
jgi:succinyl-CoA synthetase alpha subunit